MIRTEDVEKLAALARLSVPPAELEQLRSELAAILAYASDVQKVSTEASPKPETLRNVMREDREPDPPSLHTEILLSEAPAREGGYITVKKVLP